MVGPTLFSAIITPNLVPQVLEKLFSLEIVENDICLASTSKQMRFFQTNVSQKTPSTSRKGRLVLLGLDSPILPRTTLYCRGMNGEVG